MGPEQEKREAEVIEKVVAGIRGVQTAMKEISDERWRAISEAVTRKVAAQTEDPEVRKLALEAAESLHKKRQELGEA